MQFLSKEMNDPFEKHKIISSARVSTDESAFEWRVGGADKRVLLVTKQKALYCSFPFVAYDYKLFSFFHVLAAL